MKGTGSGRDEVGAAAPVSIERGCTLKEVPHEDLHAILFGQGVEFRR